ncbi:MAG: hypothetical protein ACPLPR_08505 [Bacillota bacterium]
MKVTLLKQVPVEHGRLYRDLHLVGRFKWTLAKINSEVAAGTRLLIRDLRFMRPVMVRCPGRDLKGKTPGYPFVQKAKWYPNQYRCRLGAEGLFGVRPFTFSKPTGLLEFLKGMPGFVCGFRHHCTRCNQPEQEWSVL